MIFVCGMCDLDVDADEPSGHNYYSCPNCGSPLLKKEVLVDLKNRFENETKNVTEDDIKRILAKENVVINKTKKTVLFKVKEDIIAMFELLKDPSAPWHYKIFFAAVLIYVFSPIDAIPDIVPFFGLLDDLALVTFVVAAMAAVLVKFRKKPKNAPLGQKMLTYSFCPETVQGKNYFESNSIRLWALTGADREKYNLSMYRKKLAKIHGLYASHPYFYKSLIPYNSFDNFLLEDIYRENISLLSTFGASEIIVENHEFISSEKAIDADVVKGFLAKGKVKLKNVSHNMTTQTHKNRAVNKFSLAGLDNLTWFFTAEHNSFESLPERRILHDASEFQFETHASSQLYMDINAGAALPKIGGIAIKFPKQDYIYNVYKFHVKFHPRFAEFKRNPDKMLQLVKDRLDQRRSLLENPYRQHESKNIKRIEWFKRLLPNFG